MISATRMSRYFKRKLSFYPGVYRGLATFLKLPSSGLHVTDNTDCVIEGFPRSANTYAVVAFLQAGNTHVSIGHHTHSPSNVIAGCQRKLPTIVLIRNPVDAVASASIFTKEKPSMLLDDWIWFYSVCWKFRAEFQIAEFNEVIRDFGAVVLRLNRKFSTEFDIFVSNDENVATVMREVRHIAESKGQGESQVAVPTRERRSASNKIRQDLLKQGALLENANRIYADYCALSFGEPTPKVRPAQSRGR